MKTLVTGGSGLVGEAIKSQVNKDDYLFISSKDCDLTNYDITYKYFKDHSPDNVIHLAAYVGGLFKNMNEKVEMFEKNLMINFNVIKVCYKLKIKKVICCLSTCIFPDKATYPIDESMLHEGPPHVSNNAYAYAKRMIEIQCRIYNEQFGTNFISVIPTNIYGEHDNYSIEDGHVIPALIHKCYLAKKNNTNFVVKGTGKPLRQFMYSKDLAKLILFVLKYCSSEKNSTIILSVSEKEEISIANVAKLIAKQYNYEHMLVFDSSFSDGQFKKTANNAKLMKLLKSNPEYSDFVFTPIETGIEHSVKWFKENYSNCRK